MMIQDMTIRTIAKELSRPGDGKTGKVCVSSNKLAIILHSICVFITHCILRSFRNCFWGTFVFRDAWTHHSCKVIQSVFLNIVH